MIRCSAFCLTGEGEAAREALGAARRIPRAGRPAQTQLGHGLVLTCIVVGGDGTLPAVHGFQGGGTTEGTLLTNGAGGVVASRDLAGTRPLYVGRPTPWLGTDHRFVPEEGRVKVPPGSSYSVRDGATQTRTLTFEGPLPGFEEEAARLAEALDRSVRARVEGKSLVAVAFSGGLDSSLLAHCAKRYTRVVACSVYAAGSRDERNAGDAADAVGVSLRAERLDAHRLQSESAAISLPFRPSQMDRSLWCIYSVASRAAAKEGAELILLGQLADELFGGYLKYARASATAAEEMMKEDVRACGDQGFVRDESACSRWIEPGFPYADDRIVELGLSEPVAYKLRGGVRKAVLREAARTLGLPEELVSAPKKAAQYSSGVLRMVRAFADQ